MAKGEAMALSGHCMCVAVTWTYSGDIIRNLVCHCADCQRATSSPFTAFLGLRADELNWAGDIRHYESSTDTFRGFCPSCGTRLYFRSTRWPSEIHVHAATLTDPGEYRPDAQVFMQSRLKWLDRLHSIPTHDGFQRQPARRSGA
ncbi:GFA family protein [Mesorhizobium sp.]|uniref:GFA family protein n=1 Tax=Mesorhizobium sp. TaxID=1871066 RepID=UPI0025FDED65|nr:GFA family protein [Mesorhizobium sp.]